MKLLLLTLGLAGLMQAQTLSFSPQGGKKVQLWAVSGCGVKPGSIARIYIIATEHGISWVTPAVAQDKLSKQTVWGRIARYGGFAATGATAILSTDIVNASAQIKTGFTYGAAFLNVLVPIFTQNAPTVDSLAGKDLTVDANGCTNALFYALPSNVSSFVAKVE